MIVMNTQLTVMPAMELRDVLDVAFGWVRAIEAKFAEKQSGLKTSMAGTIAAILIGAIPLGIGLLLLLVTSSAANPTKNLDSLPTLRTAGIILVLIGAGIYVLAFLSAGKRKAKNRVFEQRMDAEIAQLFQGATVLHAIPGDYRNAVALEYMIGLIDKGRADTWRECVDKYEEQVHRWTVETNTEEAVRYAASAASAARWAAIGAWTR